MSGAPPITHAEFWPPWLAMLLTFVTSRLLVQTDLIMLAPLGPEALAAFSIPGRMMIIDTIFAFALAPVVSVSVSAARDGAGRGQIVRGGLGFTLVVSLFLVAVGLLMYPRLVAFMVKEPEIARLGQQALFWMTVSIPVRMLVFVASMCLFALGEARRMVAICGVVLIANALLDWLLIYRCGLGFAGAYIATALVSSIELACLLRVLARAIAGWPFGRFARTWIDSVLGKLGAEWMRLVMWQGEGLVLLAILAARPEHVDVWAVFGVTSELTMLLWMPLIALMRTAAIKLAARKPDSIASARLTLSKVALVAILAAMVVGLMLMTLSTWIGRTLYDISDDRLDLWLTWCAAFGLALPIHAFSHLQRACFQARARFADLARVEIVIGWLLFLPLAWWTIDSGHTRLFFVAVVCKEAVIALWLTCREAEPARRERTRGAPDPVEVT